jgi:rhodanese-related sulfurtransferase
MMRMRAVIARHDREVRMSATAIATMTTIELAQRFRDDVGVHVWNVLTDEWFKDELIPGSRRVPGDRLTEAVRRSTLAPNASIVVYCQGPHCPASRQAAEKLRALGYSGVVVYEGGLDQWKQAGYGVVGTGAGA